MGEIRRREDIESLAVSISDDAIICGIRPNADPDLPDGGIVEVEFVRADLHRGAVEERDRLRVAGEAMAARLRGWPEEIAWQALTTGGHS